MEYVITDRTDNTILTWTNGTEMNITIDNAAINGTLLDEITRQWNEIYGLSEALPDDDFEDTDEVDVFLNNLSKDVIED